MAFPNTPLLDDFNRPDENPALKLPSWDRIQGGDQLILLNQALTTRTTLPGSAIYYKLLATNTEAYVDFVMPAVNGYQIEITFVILEANNQMQNNSRRVQLNLTYNSTTSKIDGIIREVTSAGGINTLATFSLPPFNAAGLKKTGNTYEAYTRTSGVWSLAQTATSSVLPNQPFTLLLTINSFGTASVVKIDNFGGGPTAGEVVAGVPVQPIPVGVTTSLSAGVPYLLPAKVVAYSLTGIGFKLSNDGSVFKYGGTPVIAAKYLRADQPITIRLEPVR